MKIFFILIIIFFSFFSQGQYSVWLSSQTGSNFSARVFTGVETYLPEIEIRVAPERPTGKENICLFVSDSIYVFIKEEGETKKRISFCSYGMAPADVVYLIELLYGSHSRDSLRVSKSLNYFQFNFKKDKKRLEKIEKLIKL